MEFAGRTVGAGRQATQVEADTLGGRLPSVFALKDFNLLNEAHLY